MKLCDLLPEIGYINSPNLSDNALIPIAYYIMNKGNINSIKVKKNWQKYYVISQVNGVFGGQSDQVLEKIRAEISRQLALGKLFDFQQIVDLKLPGGKSMRLTAEDLSDLVENTGYGSPHAYFLLSLIYPTVEFKIRRYEVDHVHPRSKFNVRNLNNNGILDKEKIEDWIDWKRDLLPNLQLLGAKDNALKKAKPIVDYLNAKNLQERKQFTAENLLPSKGDRRLELRNFDEFFEYRKQKLISKLKKHLNL
jgi:hypothetical protein